MLEVETHYLNIGQGDCTIIIARDAIAADLSTEFDERIQRVVVYDCGSSLGDNAKNALLRKCAELRIKEIAVVIISHFDQDHHNGFNAIFISSGKTAAVAARLFKSTRIYTPGIIHKTIEISPLPNNTPDNYLSVHEVYSNVKKNTITNAGVVKGLNPYVRFLMDLKDFNKKFKLNIDHVTERVLSGYPKKGEDNTPGNRYVPAKEWWPLKNKEDKDKTYPSFVQVNFEEGDFLIGKDLFNLGLTPIPEIQLVCIACNEIVDTLSDERIHLEAFGKSSTISNAKSVSCVLQFYKYTAWFGGDLETKMEDLCIKKIKSFNKEGLSVSKAGHHGANTSTSKKFLSGTDPEMVVITCGQHRLSMRPIRNEKSQHGHPGAETIGRLFSFFENKKNSSGKVGTYTTWCPRTEEYQELGVPIIGDRERFVITNSDIRIRVNENEANFHGSQRKCSFRVRTDRVVNEFISYNNDIELKTIDDFDGMMTDGVESMRISLGKNAKVHAEFSIREYRGDSDRIRFVGVNGDFEYEEEYKGRLSSKKGPLKRRRLE